MKKLFFSLSAMLLLLSCSNETNESNDLEQIRAKGLDEIEVVKIEETPENVSAKHIKDEQVHEVTLLEYYHSKLGGTIKISAKAGVSKHKTDLGVTFRRTFTELIARIYSGGSSRPINLNLKSSPGNFFFTDFVDESYRDVPFTSNTRWQSGKIFNNLLNGKWITDGFYTEYYDLKPSDVTIKDKPVITNTGSGCNDLKCIWITGQFNKNFSTRIELRKADGNREIIGIYRTGEFDFNNNESISLRLKSDNELNEFTNKGLRVYVINEEFGTWSNYADHKITNRNAPTPIITNSGSGCDDKKCIWIESKNYEISDSMRVEIRNGSTWEIISTYRGNDLNYTNFGITLRLKTDNEVNIFQNNGLRIFLVNERYGTFSSYGGNHITRR